MKVIFAICIALCASEAVAAPPYPATSNAALDASVRAACPQIDGVSGDGTIFFQPGAVCQDLAKAAMQSFVPPIPNVFLPASVLLSRLTDAEYTAIIQAGAAQLAAGNGQLSRWFDMMRVSQNVGLSDSPTVAAKAALVQAGLLTQARADAIFAP